MAKNKQPFNAANGQIKKPKMMNDAERAAFILHVESQLRRLTPEQQASLAGRILEHAEVSRETFGQFWKHLSEPSQEELGAWMMLMLDGDEEEAANANLD